MNKYVIAAALSVLAAFFIFQPIALGQEEVPPTELPPAPELCAGSYHYYSVAEHSKIVHRAFKNYHINKRDVKAHKRMVKCAESNVAENQMRQDWNKAQAKWHDKYIWEIRWDNLSAADHAWAYSTGSCESGNDPNANTGNGFFGAFQYILSTWASAPKSPGGNPINYSWTTQAVVSVYLKHRDGTGHWPNCG